MLCYSHARHSFVGGFDRLKREMTKLNFRICSKDVLVFADRT